MDIHCPACQSQQVITKNLGKKSGGLIGLVGGATVGFISAANGARTGATLTVFTGPIGLTMGTIGGAILGGLIGASSGGVTGAKLGEKLDQSVLDNYRCTNCNHSFSKPKE
ncbi:hypothetical protein JCM30760_19540 [Thiomicrorhabdus hydrogeniphila]